jgi:hypothetical protein
VLFLVVLSLVLVEGVVGRQVPTENLAPGFTWAVWFRGVALLAILVGNPWPLLSPWRTIYDGLVWLEGRSIALLGRYPTALSAWPGVLGFVVLVGVVEPLTVIPRSPRLTTVVVAAYALVMLGGSVVYGRAWLTHADPLGIFYRLFGRVSPLLVDRDEHGGWTLRLRTPWRGCTDPVASVAVVSFVVTTVFVVTFDGFTSTRSYQSLLFGVRSMLGIGPLSSLLLFCLGLGLFLGIYWLVTWLVERLGTEGSVDIRDSLRAFAPSVIPIAAAYEIAHNYPYVLDNAGQVLERTSDLVGLDLAIELLGWLSLPVYWGSQVALIVLGHVVAVVAAHSIAVERYDTRDAARRAHAPLVALMVGYTVLSLWIVSQPVVA